jgi:cyclopropane fatty-acyl-phospholipid synthase-like methyltransferase
MRMVVGIFATGGTQNFLGAGWIAPIVRHTPHRWRQNVSLRFLALSPHYFYAKDRNAESDRNRRSRAELVGDLLLQHLNPSMRVIDYGCGPGYCAIEVASKVAIVEAVDISSGVLACADSLNGAPNVEYELPDECARRTEVVDLAYSFCVIQHMSDAILADAFEMLRNRLRPQGTLLVHFALPENHWRTEEEWREDTTLKGRVKLRVGLNCFGRSAESVSELLNRAGFDDVRIESLAGRTSVDDIANQYWAIAR